MSVAIVGNSHQWKRVAIVQISSSVYLLARLRVSENEREE